MPDSINDKKLTIDIKQYLERKKKYYDEIQNVKNITTGRGKKRKSTRKKRKSTRKKRKSLHKKRKSTRKKTKSKAGKTNQKTSSLKSLSHLPRLFNKPPH